MPFYGDKCFKSQSWLSASPAAKVAMLRLWWHAWAHEVPAASIPADDLLIADYAGFSMNGQVSRSWSTIRDVCMKHFVLCNDGRYYHEFLAPLAMEAWAVRSRQSKAGRQRWNRNDQAMATATGGATDKATVKQGREIGTGISTTPHTPFTLPSWIPVPQWEAFMDMRKRMRKPPTERAKELLVVDLDLLRNQGFDVGRVLDQSVKNNWAGVFAIRGERVTPAQGSLAVDHKRGVGNDGKF